MRGLLTFPWFWICCLFNPSFPLFLLGFFFFFSWSDGAHELNGPTRWKNEVWKQSWDPYIHLKKPTALVSKKKWSQDFGHLSKTPGKDVSVGPSASEAGACFVPSPQRGVAAWYWWGGQDLRLVHPRWGVMCSRGNFQRECKKSKATRKSWCIKAVCRSQQLDLLSYRNPTPPWEAGTQPQRFCAFPIQAG